MTINQLTSHRWYHPHSSDLSIIRAFWTKSSNQELQEEKKIQDQPHTLDDKNNNRTKLFLSQDRKVRQENNCCRKNKHERS
jgi:hypothetical protein